MGIIQTATRRLYVASPSGGDPYTWYTGFDLNDFPPHVSSGAWGAQQTFQTPIAPTTTRSVTVSTLADLQTEIAIPGTQITVDTDMGGATLTALTSTIEDIDLIINPGVRMGRFRFGSSTGVVRRLRIRGPTVGTYSGGSFRSLRFGGNVAADHTDIIIDGISSSGGDENGQYSIRPSGSTRSCIVNCLIHADRDAITCDGAQHLFIGGCNIASSAVSTGGAAERWSIRHDNAGPIIAVDNDIRSLQVDGQSSYHRFRASPIVGGGTKYVFLRGGIMVDESEALGVWAFRSSSNGPTDQITAYWANDVTAYLTNGAGGSRLWAPSGGSGEGYDLVANYIRATGNTFYGDVDATYMSGQESNATATDVDHTTGNTYNTATTAPAWTGGLDPTTLPRT